MACALVVLSAPNAMVDMLIGERTQGKQDLVALDKERNYVSTILRIVGSITGETEMLQKELQPVRIIIFRKHSFPYFVLVLFGLFNLLLIMLLYAGTRHVSRESKIYWNEQWTTFLSRLGGFYQNFILFLKF